MEKTLLQIMHRLSLKYMDCPWGKDLEFQLFQQLSGLRFEHLISISKEEEESLRKYAQMTGGWYYWDKEKCSPTFLSWGAWDVIYSNWHLKNVLFAKPLL